MFTENYIKMCERAEEIQELWERKEGSWIKRDNYHEPYVLDWVGIENISVADNKWFDDMGNGFVVWLPTQEQLQEMIMAGCVAKILQLVEFTKSKAYYNYPYFESLNELWLAFLMHEKYNKIWNGEEWTKK